LDADNLAETIRVEFDCFRRIHPCRPGCIRRRISRRLAGWLSIDFYDQLFRIVIRGLQGTHRQNRQCKSSQPDQSGIPPSITADSSLSGYFRSHRGFPVLVEYLFIQM
jgi:hypothetical protein